MTALRGEPFKFTNAHGRVVKGLVYGDGDGDDAAREVGVVFLSGIVLGSTAVHRIGIELAHDLASHGHPVCLFDPAGVGESEGDYPAGTHQAVSAWVEDGVFVDDTLQTLEYLSGRTGVRRWLLVGHCGGALTGIYATAKHPAACGTVMICPPTIEMRRGDELDRDGVAAEYARQYVRKLLSPTAWLHLLRGGSSYRTIWRTVKARVLSRLRRKPTAAVRERAFNQRLRRALEVTHAGGKHIAIVFGDRDLGLEDFRAFSSEYLPAGVDVRVVQDASHGFVTEGSTEVLFAEVRRVAATLERRAV
jgi:pimeloyl-ACP methyl ester carboxylesterase